MSLRISSLFSNSDQYYVIQYSLAPWVEAIKEACDHIFSDHPMFIEPFNLIVIIYFFSLLFHDLESLFLYFFTLNASFQTRNTADYTIFPTHYYVVSVFYLVFHRYFLGYLALLLCTATSCNIVSDSLLLIGYQNKQLSISQD